MKDWHLFVEWLTGPEMESIRREFFFTSLRKLIALNAQTGKVDTEFGDKGHINLTIPYAGVPAIFKNVILMGSNFYGPGQQHIGPQLSTSKGESGDTSAYDARSERSFGIFTPFRDPAKSAMRHGAMTAGRIAPATTSGPSR